MLSVAEAKQRILADLPLMPVVQVGLNEGLGRVLGDDVVARTTQPPLAVSAMDGYAVRAEDIATVPATLNIIEEIPAGTTPKLPLASGQATRIFTGAPLPAGADTVVMQENTTRDGNRVTVSESADIGHFIRPAGLDFATGDTLIKAGKQLTARDIGLAAAMNVPWLRVRRRPLVALLSTGDEIMMPGETLGPAQIVSANNFALAGLVEATGAEPLTLGIARDNEASLQTLAAGAAGSDLLVTTGGASVGDHDLVHSALSKHGLTLDFWRIAMRPGKPLMFGRFGPVPLIGLPGNPVSAIVCAILFLQPALRAMLGIADETRTHTAILGHDLGQNDRRQEYLRATLTQNDEGEAVATPATRQDSSMFATLANADCLVVRPPNAPPAKAGSRVEIIPLGGGNIGI
ncbi:MAG: molybdopterin molybdotransferase MoeA [Alphaproteobacteria bacterium]